MEAVEDLLFYYRLVVVDVVAVLVAEGAVGVVGVAVGLQRDGKGDCKHHCEHYQYYYQEYHCSKVVIVVGVVVVVNE